MNMNLRANARENIPIFFGSTHKPLIGYYHARRVDCIRECGLIICDPMAIRQKPANNILIVQSNERWGEGRFREHLERFGAQMEYKAFPSAKSWIKDPHRPLVPNQIVQSVVHWISEIYP